MAGPKDPTDDDLLGGGESGWDEHGEGGDDGFGIPNEDIESEISEGLDGDEESAEEPVGDEEDPADDEEAGDEPTEAQEADSEELTPWERKNYSQAMQSRIQRERKLKRSAEELAAKEIDARSGAEARAYNAEKLSLDLLAKDVERDIKDKTAELRNAKEAGETDAEIQAAADLDELRAKKRQIDHATTTLKEPVKVERSTANPQTTRWIGRNQWFNTPEFSAEAHYARSIDVALSAEGKFNAGSPEYFTELDRRIHESIPTLRSKIKKQFGVKPAQRVVPSSRGSSRPSGNVATERHSLTAGEIAFARDLGLKTKEEFAAYKSEKMKRLRDEGSSKGGR